MLKFAPAASVTMRVMSSALVYSKRETQSARASTVSERTGVVDHVCTPRDVAWSHDCGKMPIFFTSPLESTQSA